MSARPAWNRLPPLLVPWLGWTGYWLWNQRWEPIALLSVFVAMTVLAYLLGREDAKDGAS